MIFTKLYKCIVGITLLLAFLIYCTWIFSHSVTTKLSFKNILHKEEFGNNSIKLGQKIKRIAYLKVPKTGSSTLSCIFIRFGIRNNISVFLYRNTFISRRKQMLLLEQGQQFDIFATHTHYNYQFFTHIVRDAAIIGSVREPGQRLISHAFYRRICEVLRRERGLSAQSCIDEIVSNTSRYKLHNIISSYFGIYNETKDISYFQELLDKLNSEFLLVIILERINESLILLKRLLHWSFVDIIYAKKKTNYHEQVVLNERQTEHIRSTNKLEYVIYDYFSNELDRKITKAGNDFSGEVGYFEHVLNQTNVYCKRTPINDNIHTFPSSRWDGKFSISLQECDLIFKMYVNKFRAGHSFV